jgi:NADP-dependent 3-hydroxy acid dehydrogenase YdfG
MDILINNAGLALGAPAAFPHLSIPDITTMVNTNINGLMYVTYAVLNRSMLPRKPGVGTILNITSITGLEVPPFPGEAMYHANKAFQEAFTNALRNELSGTDIRVLELRPGCVATNFHSVRVGHDKEEYEQFFEGFEPLVSEDIARAAIYMLSQRLNVSVKAMDVVPSAQRSITVFDRNWSERSR